MFTWEEGGHNFQKMWVKFFVEGHINYVDYHNVSILLTQRVDLACLASAIVYEELKIMTNLLWFICLHDSMNVSDSVLLWSPQLDYIFRNELLLQEFDGKDFNTLHLKLKLV